MPLYKKGRGAIPLSQPAGNGETYSSSADNLRYVNLISRSICCDEHCTNHMGEVGPSRREGP